MSPSAVALTVVCKSPQRGRRKASPALQRRESTGKCIKSPQRGRRFAEREMSSHQNSAPLISTRRPIPHPGKAGLGKALAQDMQRPPERNIKHRPRPLAEQIPTGTDLWVMSSAPTTGRMPVSRISLWHVHLARGLKRRAGLTSPPLGDFFANRLCG